LREERRLRVFENRELRIIVESKWFEVRGQWRKLHSVELSEMYISPNIIRVIKPRRKLWFVYTFGEERFIQSFDVEF
jgi:hypothetical protein